MTPASKLQAQDVRRRFTALMSGPETAIDLGYAALLIAAEEETRIDISRYLALLDEMGEVARVRLAQSASVAVEALNEFIFEEMGFAGDQLDYYDPRNSFLNHVIDRRTGIPITLSVIYMEVGRRAGLRVEGVGMPRHFIVRVRETDSAEGTLVDPFHAKTLDLKDCQDRLDAIYDGQVMLTQEHLRASTRREILARMLTNLKMIYVQAKLYRQALAVVERLQLVTPGEVGEHRDAAALLMQLDRIPEAIAETETYLRRAPRATDADEVRERLHLLQRQQAMRN
jgi:regulator of sirC expression with transglutaminase-like and TPR domain